jgi:hypothetical protein
VFIYAAETVSPTDGEAEVHAADLHRTGTIRRLATLDSHPGLFEGGAWLLVGGDVVEPHLEQQDSQLVARMAASTVRTRVGSNPRRPGVPGEI